MQLSDPDAFFGMKHALCLNAANHDAARGVSQALCWSCRVPLSASAAAEEERCAARIKQEDDALFGTDDMRVERSARASLHRGVSAHWLVHFTNAHDCWSWPTWRVVENIIKVVLSASARGAAIPHPSPAQPSTAHARCRYVHLPSIAAAANVGRADVFISHSWGGTWGDLVAAAASFADVYDGVLRVWCDIFAVRQWPGSGTCDMVFAEVVRDVNAVVVVVSTVSSACSTASRESRSFALFVMRVDRAATCSASAN